MGEAEQTRTERYITTHDPTTGQSIFNSLISPTVPESGPPGGRAVMQTLYASKGFPHQLADNADLTAYERCLAQPPDIVIGNGTVVRTVHFKPGASSHMHRTLSIDCGIVVDGQIRLELDSGESRLLQKGDVACNGPPCTRGITPAQRRPRNSCVSLSLSHHWRLRGGRSSRNIGRIKRRFEEGVGYCRGCIESSDAQRAGARMVFSTDVLRTE